MDDNADFGTVNSGQPYAIKKVKARSRAALDPVLSEVTVLSRLNHPHVVRYFAAWIEDGVNLGSKDSESSDDDYSSSFTNDGGQRSVLPLSSRGLDFISSSNAQVVFADDYDEGSSPEDDDNANAENSEDDTDSIRTLSHCHGDEPLQCAEDELSSAPGQPNWTVLYIQMEYCKQEVNSFQLTLSGLVAVKLTILDSTRPDQCWSPHE